MGDALPAVRLGRPAVALAAAGARTCAILNDGSVKCWGDNANAQLGVGDRRDRGVLASDMDELLAIDLGAGRSAVDVAIAADHACARLDHGTVKCWGQASALGLGESDGARGDVPNEMGDALPAVLLE